jgi:glycosyltransferase involved in cell wall biosynthesis
MTGISKHTLPSVSCLCVTFARPELLEEAIQSFLNQDYAGEKELIILNDFHLQDLSIDHPEISIINLPRKVSTLGEKRNMAAALSKGSVLFPWDDDDISLPFRVSQSISFLINEKAEYYKPTTALLWNNGSIDEINKNNFHAQSCYTRELFNQVFYSAMGSGEDQDFDKKIKEILKTDIATAVLPQQNFYLYRWYGTGSYHISVITSEDDQDAETVLLKQQTAKAELSEIPTGKIFLRPNWKIDYAQQAKNFMAALV